MGKEGYYPLFETKQGEGRIIHRIWATSIFISICFIWIYRLTQMPDQARLSWILMFLAEIWCSFYWFHTQTLRWNCIYRCAFKDRLSERYEQELPKVDIFVCTSDPVIEPPLMVINTVLSVMAYDYPPEKLTVFLSDDGGSILTFYALLLASHFAKYWLPYARKYHVEPTSPAAYFNSFPSPTSTLHFKDFQSIKSLYEEMSSRIDASMTSNGISEEVLKTHKGFSKWNDSYISKQDHATILQILIDGRNAEEIDAEVKGVCRNKQCISNPECRLYIVLQQFTVNSRRFMFLYG